MNSQKYNYDVAFSFLVQDELLAINLFNLLSKSLHCFIYTEEQKKIAGTDGEAAFNRVFSEEARIVVILYSGDWGKTKWTRIEETAIRNRGFDEGYDFTIFIPLEDNPSPPKWLPKNRLWIGINRWGIESAAAVIEARAQEFGSQIKSVSIVDEIAIREKEIIHEKEISGFLKSDEGHKEASTQFNKLITEGKSKAEKIIETTQNWNLKIRNNERSGIDLISYGYQLSFQYYLDYIKPYMFVVLFEGWFNDQGNTDPFNPAKSLFHDRYIYHIDKYDQKGWIFRDSNTGFIHTNELVDKWLGKLMKYAADNRKNMKY